MNKYAIKSFRFHRHRRNVRCTSVADLQINGQGSQKKIFFRPFGLQFGLEIRGEPFPSPGPPQDPPLRIRTGRKEEALARSVYLAPKTSYAPTHRLHSKAKKRRETVLTICKGPCCETHAYQTEPLPPSLIIPFGG